MLADLASPLMMACCGMSISFNRFAVRLVGLPKTATPFVASSLGQSQVFDDSPADFLRVLEPGLPDLNDLLGDHLSERVVAILEADGA